jgi:Ca2+-binding RTX toxin-like protein
VGKQQQQSARVSRAQVVEPLECRALLSGVTLLPVTFASRAVMSVAGDNAADDVITVGVNSDQTKIVVSINGQQQDPVDLGGVRAIIVRGLGGDDQISVKDGFNFSRLRITVVFDGGDGNDTLTGGDGNEALRGGAGDDTIDAGDGNNSIQGGDGSDRITAGNGKNLIMTGAGDNVVRAGDGGNRVLCGDGNDDVRTGLGNDTVSGGGGDDVIRLGDGDNRATGGAGDDQITGGTGKDSIRGGAGNDTLNGGGGGGSADTIVQDDPAAPVFKRPAGLRRYLARLAAMQAQQPHS